MTVALIGVCVTAFIGTLGRSAMVAEQPSGVLADSWLGLQACGPTLESAGALRLSALWLDGEWWRVISTGLLHGSWIHLLLNIWSLWVVGELAERAWGHVRLLVLFGMSSVVGCLASAAWVEAPMVVGASAGILGIAGALLIGRVLGRGTVGQVLAPVSARVLGGWLLALVLLGFFVDMIAQAGHLGGLAAGALIGLAWSGLGTTAALGGRMGIALLLAGLMLAARQPERRPKYNELLGYALLERGHDGRAVEAFERALTDSPEDHALANAVAYGLAEAGVRLGEAEVLVREALEQAPENADYLDTLGWILCRRGKVDEGLGWIEKASEASGGEVAEIEGHRDECAAARVP